MGTGDEWDATNGKAFGLSDGKGHADAVFFEIVTLQLTAGDSVSETVVFNNFEPETGYGCVYHSSATCDGKESRNFRGVGGRETNYVRNVHAMLPFCFLRYELRSVLDLWC